MTSAFDAMTHLEEFHLHCWPSDDTDTLASSIPFIHAAFASLGSNLRELIMDASLESLSHAVGPDLVFNSLEVLLIRFCKSYKLPHAAKVLRDIVVPFINNHQSTLRSFDLAEPNFKVKMDFEVTALFFGMTYFPHLWKISVGVPLNGLETVALTRFLDRHKAQILHLEILNEHGGSFYDVEPLIGLQHLVLAKPSHLPHYEKLISLLQNSGGYLRSLTLVNHQIGYNAAIAVFLAISQCEMLQELSLRADFPDSYLLNLFAESLPNIYAVNLLVDRDALSIRSVGYFAICLCTVYSHPASAVWLRHQLALSFWDEDAPL